MYRQSEKLLNSNISSTRPHNMTNFGPLSAEIGSGVWGTPENYNEFRVLPSLLQRRRSLEANQTLHDVWPSPGWYAIYTFSAAAGYWRNFARCKIHFASKSCILLYWPALLHGNQAAKLRGVVQGMELRNFCRGRHLYSAGLPSRWASAHILVMAALYVIRGSLYFCPVISIYRLSIFFSSPNLSGRRLDVYHTLTHGVAQCEFRMQV